MAASHGVTHAVTSSGGHHSKHVHPHPARQAHPQNEQDAVHRASRNPQTGRKADDTGAAITAMTGSSTNGQTVGTVVDTIA